MDLIQKIDSRLLAGAAIGSAAGVCLNALLDSTEPLSTWSFWGGVAGGAAGLVGGTLRSRRTRAPEETGAVAPATKNSLVAWLDVPMVLAALGYVAVMTLQRIRGDAADPKVLGTRVGAALFLVGLVLEVASRRRSSRDSADLRWTEFGSFIEALAFGVILTGLGAALGTLVIDVTGSSIEWDFYGMATGQVIFYVCFGRWLWREWQERRISAPPRDAT